jgi:hypothetical protein
MRMPQAFHFLKLAWLRVAAFGLLALCFTTQASAVVTVTSGYTGVRSITMQVGTATSGVVDVVQFNVANTPTGNSQTYAASVNGNGVPLLASSGGVLIAINMRTPSALGTQSFTTTVTSPASLTCASGGCGSASIPFSTISWTSTTVATASNAAFDIQNGVFIPGTTQNLNSFPTGTNTTMGGGSIVNWANTMTFSYTSAIAYPAGNYTGRVTYTATFL